MVWDAERPIARTGSVSTERQKFRNVATPFKRLAGALGRVAFASASTREIWGGIEDFKEAGGRQTHPRRGPHCR